MLQEFFTLSAKAIMLTKSAIKGVTLIKTMTDLELSVSAELHLNPVIEACFRGGKSHLIQDLLPSDSNTAINIQSLKLLIKYYTKYN